GALLAAGVLLAVGQTVEVVVDSVGTLRVPALGGRLIAARVVPEAGELAAVEAGVAVVAHAVAAALGDERGPGGGVGQRVDRVRPVADDDGLVLAVAVGTVDVAVPVVVLTVRAVRVRRLAGADDAVLARAVVAVDETVVVVVQPVDA